MSTLDNIDRLREAAIAWGSAVGTAGRLRQYQEELEEAERQLRSDIEQLRADLAHYHQLEDVFEAKDSENERLRAALEKIAQWDCLNPPVSHIACVRDASDFHWLRGVVDEALWPT